MSGIWFGAAFLALLCGIAVIGVLIAAAALWVLYRRQGGRRGLAAWIRCL